MSLVTGKTTLGYILTTVFLSVVMLSTWFALERIEFETKKNIRESLHVVIHTTQESLHLWLRHRKEALSETTKNPKVLKLANLLLLEHQKQLDPSKSITLTRLRLLLADKMNQHGDKGFFIIAPDRINVASMRNINLGKTNVIHQQRKEYLDRAFAGETLFIPTVISDVPLKTRSGVIRDHLPTIFIASPILSDSGAVIAVLTLRLDPFQDFSRITQLGQIGATGETYAFDEQGTLITEIRFNHQLHFIGLSDPDGRGMMTIQIRDPGGNMLEGFSPSLPDNERPLTLMASSAIAGQSGFNLDGYRDYRGVLVYGTWAWDRALGFGLATEIDVNEAMRSYHDTRITIIIVLILTVMLSLGLVVTMLWLESKSQQKLINAHKQLTDKVHEVAQLNHELEMLSFQDGLTSIANRRMFDQLLAREWNRAKRNHQDISLIMIDIDYFKQYNDHYGHQEGDECLKRVAKVLSLVSKRATDLLARYGGEEFVILLPETEKEMAITLAEKCRNDIIAQQIPHVASQINLCVSISVGVSTILPTVKIKSAQLVKRADKALYRAKVDGRNRIASDESSNC